MKAAELVEALQSQGVRLEVVNDRLRVTPASRLTVEQRAALASLACEVGALVSGPPSPPDPVPVPVVPLDRTTTRELLGTRPDPAALAALRAEVGAALRQLEAEVTGAAPIRPDVLLVRGRPIADFLDLDVLVRVLDRTPWRSTADGPCPACHRSSWWTSTAGRTVCRLCHPPASPELEATP
jgi:hypothetical protein